MNTIKTQANNINILIVDDNPNNLRLLSNILTEHGYQTRRVISGKMALQAVKANKFDLIFLDINIPEMNGYEICHQLKSDDQTSNIPVIFISALDEVVDKVKAFEVGGIDYITKPFQFEEVIARVENQVKILSLQQDLQNLNSNLEAEIAQRTHELEKSNRELRKTQKVLLNKSLRDPVTNLDNKVSLMGKLRKAVALTKIQANSYFTLFLFNCYCPELINTSLYLELENAIAIAIANQLNEYNTDYSFVARLDNNEFVIIINQLNNFEKAEIIAQKIQHKFDAPLYIQSKDIDVKIDYGIVIVNDDSEPVDSIVKKAKILAYKAKNNSNIIYQNKISDRDNLKISNILQLFTTAFKNKKIELCYQPIVCLKNNQILEVEVFLSQKKSTNHFILTQDIVKTIYQEDKLANDLLKWTLKTANQDLIKWQERIIWDQKLQDIEKDILIRLKILDSQLLIPNFSELLKISLNNLELEPKNVILEIPELFIHNNHEVLAKIIQKIHKSGIKFSLDNLSIKYLTINSIYNFPINNFKLSNFIFNNINNSNQKETMITNILNLAKSTNMNIIVTDIETEEQLKYWQQLGCQLGMGKFVSNPVTFDRIENLIINNLSSKKK